MAARAAAQTQEAVGQDAALQEGVELVSYVKVRRNIHLSADFAGFAMKPHTRWRLDLAGLLLCILFLGVYGWNSFKVIDAMDGIPFTSLPLEQPALYWPLPASALLMALALVVRVHADFGQRPV